MCGPHNIFVSTLRAVFEDCDIPDEAIDAFLFNICKSCPGSMHIVTETLAKILEGSKRACNAYFLKQNILKKKILGAYLQNGNHWTLFYADMDNLTIVFMDSFGESKEKTKTLVKNWSSFAEARGCHGPWTVVSVKHPKQTDSHSCGIHVIMYAEAIMIGDALRNGHVPDFGPIASVRAQLCKQLFNLSDRTGKCSECLLTLRPANKVQCRGCGANRHKRCAQKCCRLCEYCEQIRLHGGDEENDQRTEKEEEERVESQAKNEKEVEEKVESQEKNEMEVEEKDEEDRNEMVAVEDREKEEEKEKEEGQSQSQPDFFVVPGRLAITGPKKKTYTITPEEINRRIVGEKMSAHVFRCLLGGRMANLPAIVRQQPPKKKSVTSIFSCLSEGEASDLATGFGSSLARHFKPVVEGVSKETAESTK
ncbi:uncharacterized protein LOC134460149 [Engraulis encrasicolus]|uniref:uncharacterized protein LOC134460149 n=1 Tax=Engraulis encrasicolus TaxID=184585 RepID=UPI002FD2F377